MVAVIHQFKFYSEGIRLPYSNFYVATETPKGEFGVFVVGNNQNRIYRCKIRAPGFFHLQSLSTIARGLLLGDLVAVIGTLDIVFGEVDR
jgi:NADH-quinone oxidoreductase subunit D